MAERNLVAAFGALASLLFAASASATITTIETTRVATGLSNPLYATSPNGDSARLFIVEQHSGNIKVFDRVNGLTMSTPFLNVGNVSQGFEQGLLGLAFHPDYNNNGLLYVNLTNTEGNTVVREYRVANPASNQATILSQRTIISYDQPFGNHNGGWIGFGPDDYLYISSGDGGSGNDPNNNAQDITDNKLGKILRIDVNSDAFPGDANRNYAVPTNNPFFGQTGDDEIWAYGVRNPWRASFDRATGDFWFGDVGQNAIEEINFQPAGSPGGENYGWRIFEGSRQNIGAGVAGTVFDGSDKVFPVFEYDHGQGSSVTGGYVYRGPIQALQGKYFFADFGSGSIWTAEPDGRGGFDVNDVTSLFTTDAGRIGNVASFAEDGDGNLYIVDIFGGELFQITAVPLPLPIVLMLSALAGMLPFTRRRN